MDNPSEEINWFDFKKGDIFKISKKLSDYNLGYGISYKQHKRIIILLYFLILLY